MDMFTERNVVKKRRKIVYIIFIAVFIALKMIKDISTRFFAL